MLQKEGLGVIIEPLKQLRYENVFLRSSKSWIAVVQWMCIQYYRRYSESALSLWGEDLTNDLVTY